MDVLNKLVVNSTEDVGGLGACFIGCGVFCFGTGGSATAVASAAFLV